MGFSANPQYDITSLRQLLGASGSGNPSALATALGAIGPLFMVIDEFDRIQNSATKAQFADLIKDLSDNNPKVTVLLVGVAKDVEELTGHHPSVERCIRQVHLPRMSPDELREMLTRARRAPAEDWKETPPISLRESAPEALRPASGRADTALGSRRQLSLVEPLEPCSQFPPRPTLPRAASALAWGGGWRPPPAPPAARPAPPRSRAARDLLINDDTLALAQAALRATVAVQGRQREGAPATASNSHPVLDVRGRAAGPWTPGGAC